MQIFERTVDNYKKLYPLLKDQPAFLFEYGQCLSRTGQPETSNLILEEAARLSADPMIRNIMGKNYQTMKQYPQAESAFLKASRMVPNRLYPLYLLSKMYRQGHCHCPLTTRKSPQSPLFRRRGDETGYAETNYRYSIEPHFIYYKLVMPMSITLIAGMTVGTFVSLFIIPLFYYYLERIFISRKK